MSTYTKRGSSIRLQDYDSHAKCWVVMHATKKTVSNINATEIKYYHRCCRLTRLYLERDKRNRVTDWSPIGKEDSGRPGICWVWSSLTGI